MTTLTYYLDGIETDMNRLTIENLEIIQCPCGAEFARCLDPNATVEFMHRTTESQLAALRFHYSHCEYAQKRTTEADRVALYQALLAQGLSDAEARGTAWPTAYNSEV